MELATSNLNWSYVITPSNLEGGTDVRVHRNCRQQWQLLRQLRPRLAGVGEILERLEHLHRLLDPAMLQHLRCSEADDEKLTELEGSARAPRHDERVHARVAVGCGERARFELVPLEHALRVNGAPSPRRACRAFTSKRQPKRATWPTRTPIQSRCAQVSTISASP